jgi:hypothetical protein
MVLLLRAHRVYSFPTSAVQAVEEYVLNDDEIDEFRLNVTVVTWKVHHFFGLVGLVTSG